MVNFNPMATTVAAGSFNVQSTGYIAGTLLDNPPDLYRIAGGTLAGTEVLPMFGGVAISEAIPGSAGGPRAELGSVVSRSTALSNTTAIAIFNQAHNYLNFPQSPVPVANPGMSVNFVRLGSGVRLAVAIDPALVSLDGSLINTQVSWDFVNNQLVTYQAAYAANVLTASTWFGGQVTFTTTSAHGVNVGSSFTITGSVPAAYNGTYIALAGTTGSTLIGALAANPGTIVTEGTLAAGGGAFPAKILDIDAGNSMVPSYSATTGFATWNRNGACAAILI